MAAITTSDFKTIGSKADAASFDERIVAYKTSKEEPEEYTLGDVHFGYLRKSYGDRMMMCTLMKKVQKVATSSVSGAAKDDLPPLAPLNEVESSALWRNTRVLDTQTREDKIATEMFRSRGAISKKESL
jgi:hypothetical protein